MFAIDEKKTADEKLLEKTLNIFFVSCFSAEIEQKYTEIMQQTGILTLNGKVCLLESLSYLLPYKIGLGDMWILQLLYQYHNSFSQSRCSRGFISLSGTGFDTMKIAKYHILSHKILSEMSVLLK